MSAAKIAAILRFMNTSPEHDKRRQNAASGGTAQPRSSAPHRREAAQFIDLFDRPMRRPSMQGGG
jgi:hypothetical protein